MRYFIALLIAVLVLGCTAPAEVSTPEGTNVKDTFKLELPRVDGFYINTVAYIESPSESQDALVEKAEQGVYLSEDYEPFIYTKQKIMQGKENAREFDFSEIEPTEIESHAVYLDYKENIPLVSASGYNIAWKDDRSIYTITGYNKSVALHSAEMLLASNELAEEKDYAFVDIIGILPDPAAGWDLYMVTPGMFLSSYNNTVGYYIHEIDENTSETMEVIVVRGNGAAKYVEGKINDLESKKGATVAGRAVYEGPGQGIMGLDYKKIFYSEDKSTGVIISVGRDKEGSDLLEELFLEVISNTEYQ